MPFLRSSYIKILSPIILVFEELYENTSTQHVLYTKIELQNDNIFMQIAWGGDHNDY